MPADFIHSNGPYGGHAFTYKTPSGFFLTILTDSHGLPDRFAVRSARRWFWYRLFYLGKELGAAPASFPERYLQIIEQIGNRVCRYEREGDVTVRE